MSVNVDIPEDVVGVLKARLEGPLDREVLEAASVQWYREGRLLHSQFARLLGISRYEADGVLKRHGMEREMPLSEFEEDVNAALGRGKR